MLEEKDLPDQPDPAANTRKEQIAMTNEEEILEILGKYGELLKEMRDDISGIKVRMEVEVKEQFNLLAENQQIMLDKLERLDDMEVMDTRITALEAMVKKLNREMEKLKKAQ